MNVHDSEKMAGVLSREGMSPAASEHEADLIILNTCSIRQKAEQKFRSNLGRLKLLKLKRPGLKVAVSGCIAQQMGSAMLKRTPQVDYVLGTENIHALRDIARDDNYERVFTSINPSITTHELPKLREDKGRAWISIMYGCDNFCTYCVVPYTRGRERSRPAPGIRQEIEALCSDGACREVTLLGQNVNSYASDTDFAGLLRLLDTVEGLWRVRFVTSHPRDFSDSLIDAITELGSVCEHVHLPMQSGSDRVLGLMNRGYTYEDYRARVQRLRDAVPGVAITTDIIAGFPSESAEEHARTMSAISEIEFDGVFAFRFSPRPGTKAAGMDGMLGEDVKQSRLAEIFQAQDAITLKKNRALEGSLVEVLLEGPSSTDPSVSTGRTRTNKIVNLRTNARAGELIMARITRGRKHSLLAEQEQAPLA